MQSMTGFGCSSLSSKDFKLEATVKSLNSRFLDIKFSMPAYCNSLESELKKIITSTFGRGYFVVVIERYPPKPLPTLSLKWNKKQVQQWKTLYNKLSKELKLPCDITVEDLIGKEGVVQCVDVPPKLPLQEKKQVKKCFLTAFQACLQERKREGTGLKKDILSQIKTLSSFSSKMKTLNKKQKDHYMRQKNLSLEKDNSNKGQTLEVEKFDLNEEIVRLTEHLKHFKKITNSSKPMGRKLDFYVQEMLREINTMGSKSQISDLTLQVVEGKFILEKIKEQIQNVE